MKAILVLFACLLLTVSAKPCKVSIVGAGLSGVYSAYRLSMANESFVKPEEICLFDATESAGGRLLSVDDLNDGFIDLGVDHFKTSSAPLFHALVKKLGIETECLFTGEETRSETGSATPEETVVEKEVTVVKTDDTGAEVGNEPVNPEETTGQKRHAPFFKPKRRPRSRFEARAVDTETVGEEVTVIKEEDTAPPETKTESNLPTKTETQPETKTMTETDKSMEAQPQAAKACAKRPRYRLFGNKIYKSDVNEEELGVKLTLPLDQLKDLPKLAFDKVFPESASILEDSENEASNADPSQITDLIERIKAGEFKYNDIPLHEISMIDILRNEHGLTSTDIQVGILFSDKYEHLGDMLITDYQSSVINMLKRKIAGEGDEMKVKGGMYSVINSMMTELSDKGVQIYLNTKLDGVFISERLIMLHFEGIDKYVPTERLFVAFNQKNLRRIFGSDLVQQLSLPVAEMIGSLQEKKETHLAIYFDEPWWDKLGLNGAVLTDGDQTLTYHTLDCGQDSCPGWVKIASENTLPIDIHNPIDRASILLQVMGEKISDSSNTSSVSGITAETMQEVSRDNLVLSLLQKQLIKIHENMEGFENNTIPEPTFAYSANWANDGIFTWGTRPLPSRIDYRTFSLTMMEPIPTKNIHFVNHHFSRSNTDLDSSIVNVERVLSLILGMNAPDWYEKSIFDTHVDF